MLADNWAQVLELELVVFVESSLMKGLATVVGSLITMVVVLGLEGRFVCVVDTASLRLHLVPLFCLRPRLHSRHHRLDDCYSILLVLVVVSDSDDAYHGHPGFDVLPLTDQGTGPTVYCRVNVEAVSVGRWFGYCTFVSGLDWALLKV